MLQINKIIFREIQLPLKEPFQISSGTMSIRRFLLLELIDQNGITGWSECVADELPNYTPETIDTCWLAIKEWIAPRILGKNFNHPNEIHKVVDADIRGHDMAKAGIEMGAWELTAQIQGVPLSKLIGGTRDRIATGISLGIQDSPKILADKTQSCLAEGYNKIKIKIKPGKDIKFLSAVREALGMAAKIMADANNAYTLADIDILKQLDQFGLMMIEQPLAWDDIIRHATLQQQLKTPICLDESITNLEKAEDMVALGSGKIINIKPGRVGGFTSSIAIHDFCQENNIPVWCGGMLESGIGRAHNVALASLPNFVLPGDVSPSSRYWQQDIVKPEWTMDDNGMVTVPLDKPGMGVEVDMDRVDNLTVRSETLHVS